MKTALFCILALSGLESRENKCESVFNCNSLFHPGFSISGVPLDGKSMRIEILGEVPMAPVSSRLGRKNSPPRQQRDRSPFRRARGGRGGRPNQKPAGGKPQREKREKKETPSAEDLDKVS